MTREQVQAATLARMLLQSGPASLLHISSNKPRADEMMNLVFDLVSKESAEARLFASRGKIVVRECTLFFESVNYPRDKYRGMLPEAVIVGSNNVGITRPKKAQVRGRTR